MFGSDSFSYIFSDALNSFHLRDLPIFHFSPRVKRMVLQSKTLSYLLSQICQMISEYREYQETNLNSLHEKKIS